MATWTTTVECDLTPRELAEVFCAQNDEEQAQFFVEVAKVLDRWSPHARDMQLHYIAGHMKTCECVSEDARNWVREIATAMDRR